MPPHSSYSGGLRGGIHSTVFHTYIHFLNIIFNYFFLEGVTLTPYSYNPPPPNTKEVIPTSTSLLIYLCSRNDSQISSLAITDHLNMSWTITLGYKLDTWFLSIIFPLLICLLVFVLHKYVHFLCCE